MPELGHLITPADRKAVGKAKKLPFSLYSGKRRQVGNVGWKGRRAVGQLLQCQLPWELRFEEKDFLKVLLELT